VTDTLVELARDRDLETRAGEAGLRLVRECFTFDRFTMASAPPRPPQGSSARPAKAVS